MVQRNSGYARQPSDNYTTPAWVVDLLFQNEEFEGSIWEPAPGEGAMVEAILRHSPDVYFTKDNFLEINQDAKNIITNPPFSVAEDFCHQALKNTQRKRGKVAMLLPTYFDNGKAPLRKSLFTLLPFKIKYVLTERIRWTNLEQKKNGPSTNHAWYVWDWNLSEEPKIWWL